MRVRPRPPPSAQSTGNDRSNSNLGKCSKKSSPPVLKHPEGQFPNLLTQMESAPYPARKRPDGVAPPRAPMGPESPIHCPKGPTAGGRQTRLALGSCDWRGRGRNWALPAKQHWNTAPDGRRFRATLTLRARAAQWRLSAPGELRQCVHLDYNSQKPPRRGAAHVVGGGHLGGHLGAVGEAPVAERAPLVIPLGQEEAFEGQVGPLVGPSTCMGGDAG